MGGVEVGAMTERTKLVIEDMVIMLIEVCLVGAMVGAVGLVVYWIVWR